MEFAIHTAQQIHKPKESQMLSILLPLIACSEKPPVVEEPPVIIEDECEDIERLVVEDETILDVVESNHGKHLLVP